MPEETRVERIIRREEQLRSSKSRWHRHWDDLARVMLTRRAGFVADNDSEGERRTDDIFDGTAMQMARGLGNALATFMWPEGERNFNIRVVDDEGDEDDVGGEAAAWLDRAARRVQRELDSARSKFRESRGEVDLDLTVFGSAVMFIGEREARDSVLYTTVHLKDISIVFNKEGDPEGAYQRKKMPLRQALARWPNKFNAEFKQRAEKEPDSKETFIRVIEQRDKGRPDAILAKDLPFTDDWIYVEGKILLEESGHHEFPFVVPRWDTSSGEDYGRSPGMIALPDTDTLQAMGETMLVAGQRAADPPLMVPNDGSFNELYTAPGDMSYYDLESAAIVGGNPFFPLETGANMPLTRDMQLDYRDQVTRAFFKNLLNLPVEGPEMTATEVIARKEEFIRELGPVFGRLQSGYTAPVVERTFMLMLRRGRLGALPESLSKRKIDFVYESPVEKIRKQVIVSAARLWADQQFAWSEFKEEAADLPNIEAIGRFSAEAMGLPSEFVNSPDDVKAMAEARAQEREQAAALAAAEQAAQAARAGAQAAQAGGLVPEQQAAA